MPLQSFKTVVEPAASVAKPAYVVCKKHDFPEGLCPYCKDDEISRLNSEITRLKEGNFTPEELTEMYHHCGRKLREHACKECGALPDMDGLIDHHRACSKEGMIDRIKGSA